MLVALLLVGAGAGCDVIATGSRLYAANQERIAEDKLSETPLFKAADRGEITELRRLAQERDPQGHLPLGVGDPGIRLLLAYGTSPAPDVDKRSRAITDAILHDDLEALKSLGASKEDLQRRNPDGSNAFGLAFGQADRADSPSSPAKAVLDYLKSVGVRAVNLQPGSRPARNDEATVALQGFYSATRGPGKERGAMFTWVDERAIVAALSAGADPNVVLGGADLLHRLVEIDSDRVIGAALEAGSDANAVDANGLTPLLVSCNGSERRWVVEMLLAAGADPNAADKSGRTALLPALAQARWGTAAQLIDHGARPTAAVADAAMKEYANSLWAVTPPIPATLVAAFKAQGVVLKKPSYDFAESLPWTYFPMRPGALWTYVHRNGPAAGRVAREIYVQRVEPPRRFKYSMTKAELEARDRRDATTIEWADDTTDAVTGNYSFSYKALVAQDKWKTQFVILRDPTKGWFTSVEGSTDPIRSDPLTVTGRYGGFENDQWSVLESNVAVTIDATQWERPQGPIRTESPSIPATGSTPSRTYRTCYKLKHHHRDIRLGDAVQEIAYFAPMVGVVRREIPKPDGTTDIQELVDHIAEAP